MIGIPYGRLLIINNNLFRMQTLSLSMQLKRITVKILW